jgi:hypothetical protein
MSPTNTLTESENGLQTTSPGSRAGQCPNQTRHSYLGTLYLPGIGAHSTAWPSATPTGADIVSLTLRSDGASVASSGHRTRNLGADWNREHETSALSQFQSECVNTNARSVDGDNFILGTRSGAEHVTTNYSLPEGTAGVSPNSHQGREDGSVCHPPSLAQYTLTAVATPITPHASNTQEHQPTPNYLNYEQTSSVERGADYPGFPYATWNSELLSSSRNIGYPGPLSEGFAALAPDPSSSSSPHSTGSSSSGKGGWQATFHPHPVSNSLASPVHDPYHRTSESALLGSGSNSRLRVSTFASALDPQMFELPPLPPRILPSTYLYPSVDTFELSRTTVGHTRSYVYTSNGEGSSRSDYIPMSNYYSTYATPYIQRTELDSTESQEAQRVSFPRNEYPNTISEQAVASEVGASLPNSKDTPAPAPAPLLPYTSQVASEFSASRLP